MPVNFDKLRNIFSIVSLIRGNYIEGVMPIRDDNGNIIFEYKISIDFQTAIPTVKELEELIPHDIDRHLYPDSDWNLCLGYPLMLHSFWINCGYDCYAYVEKKILPYLANQHYFDRNGEWFIKGFDHNINGTLEFYSEIFKTDNSKIILSRISDVLNNRKYMRNGACFCGSELKFKHCHQKRNLIQYERNILQNDYNRISSNLKSKN